MAESRWTTEFKQHPFQAIWQQIRGELAELEVQDKTVETEVLELVRLKRIVTYIDTLLRNVDPDLTPKSVWSNFNNQVGPCLQQIIEFKADKNIGHIRSANDHLDNLLSYIRPYEVLPAKVLTALADSSRTYAEELISVVKSFKETSSRTLIQINEDRAAVAQDRSTTDKHRKRIEAYFNELFEGATENESVEMKIANLLATTKVNAKAIEDLHAALLVGSPDNLSIQARVKGASVETEQTRDKLNTLLDGVQTEVRALNAFHEKIFGKKDDSGTYTGGLDAELDARLVQLNSLETDQKSKYSALVAQVETLLPGATSAGLASSYKTLKDSFKKPILIYTLSFAGSLAVLVLAALVMAVQEFTWTPFHFKLVEVAEWDTILRALMYKAPFVAPVVWLAIFSSTRRSQYERLQQEYAHKEALAASYQSYKTQLEALKAEGEELQRELIAKAIDAIAYNASTTLDGKHQENLPAQQLLEKINMDELKKFLDFLKGWKA